MPDELLEDAIYNYESPICAFRDGFEIDWPDGDFTIVFVSYGQDGEDGHYLYGCVDHVDDGESRGQVLIESRATENFEQEMPTTCTAPDMDDRCERGCN